MDLNNGKVAGLLLFFGSVQFLLAILIGAMLYPGYSIANNYISDLGVGSTALLFNSSVILFGIIGIVTAYFVYRAYAPTTLLAARLFAILLILFGIGAMGAGLFPETFVIIHYIFSLLAFGSGGITVIISFKLLDPPLSYISIILGVMTLVALVLFTFYIHLGLGMGGIERLIVYPALIWAISFSTYLMSKS